MLGAFTFALIWAIVRPPDNPRSAEVIIQNGVSGREVFSNVIPLALAFSFGLVNACAHALALAMCFKREYVQRWMPENLNEARCDQFAEREDGSLYVPWSYVSLFGLFRTVLLTAALVFVVVMTLRDEGRFEPM